MKKGKVDWYSEEKGFGVIIPDNGGINAIFTSSELEYSGYKTIYKNTKVSYIDKAFNNKNHAFNIKIIG